MITAVELHDPLTGGLPDDIKAARDQIVEIACRNDDLGDNETALGDALDALINGVAARVSGQAWIEDRDPLPEHPEQYREGDDLSKDFLGATVLDVRTAGPRVAVVYQWAESPLALNEAQSLLGKHGDSPNAWHSMDGVLGGRGIRRAWIAQHKTARAALLQASAEAAVGRQVDLYIDRVSWSSNDGRRAVRPEVAGIHLGTYIPE